MSMVTLSDKNFGGDMPGYWRTRGGRVLFLSLLSIFTLLLSVCASAQEEDPAKYEIFLGYQWLHPGATIPAPGAPADAPVPLTLRDMGDGAGASFTYNFVKHLGLVGDFGRNFTDNANETTVSVGPKLQTGNEGVNLFLNTMLSWNHLNVSGLGSRDGIGAVLGGGVDLRITRHFGVRVLEADYVWAHQNFSDVVSSSFPGLRRPNFDGARLRSGLLWYMGLPPQATPTAACSVQPSEVMVGEPVTATANGKDFNPKHTLNYTWTSTGGKISGKDITASIDTNGIAGGTYTATANITDPKQKKATATCSATFTVKEPPKNPPTLSCSADPSSLQAGGNSTVTCSCTSPDNVPVTVGDWTASSGTISGNGSTATLNTTGASAGPITVTATCTDSRGLKSNAASTQVTVENPPAPPAPQASKLSQCDFPNKVKPWRVDNTCKAILDDVAKNLQQNADSKLVIVGNADPSEKRKNLAAERAVNSKAYLTGGEAKLGIDASRIETRTGGAGTTTAEYWTVPAGATFSGEGTTPVDESQVKAVPDHPRAAAKKKAKAAQ
jgi:outer membrane protein OmpA-like peptidoglycan-associated protein